MMNFLLSSVTELTDIKKPYMFNLFDSSNSNAHLVAIGNSGANKRPFFHQLIEQEHKQYASITSFILNQHGREEYQEVWDFAQTKNLHRVEEYTINPLDCCYLGEEHTVQKVNKLLHSIGLSLSIDWTDLHDKLTKEYIKQLLINYGEEQLIPTIHDLYIIVKSNTINYTKQEMLTLLDICTVLDLFEDDSLPLKRMFNGMTDIPCYDDKEVVYIEGGGVLKEYLAPYTSLLIEHLYLLQRYSLQQETFFIAAPNNHKVAFYQDGFLSFYDDPCYLYLTNFVVRSDLTMQLGVRLSTDILCDLLKTNPVLQACEQYYV